MNKQQMIESVLSENITVSTREAIKQIKDKFKIKVSVRSVQRTRKRLIAEGSKMENLSDVNPNEDSDVFDTGVPDNKTVEKTIDEIVSDDKIINLNGLSDDDIIVLNLANEGGWSVEQIADSVKKNDGGSFTSDEVRNILTRLKDMVQGEVLDEENPEVYLTTGTKDILEELDALPTTPIRGTFRNVGVGFGGTVGQENFWEVKQDCVTQCSKAANSINVFMNIVSRRRSMLYMKWAGAREWLAYLLGEFKDGSYYVTDLYLPDQRTSSALVDNINNDEFNKLPIIGVIHSHHEMGAGDANNPSFSGHDASFINSNHNLSLLAGRDRVGGGFKIVGIARVKTPCDAFIQIKANIKSMVEDPEGDKALKDEFLEKTQTQTHTYNYNRWENGYGYGFNPYGGYPKSQIVHPVTVVGGPNKVLKPDETGIVRTRGQGFHFNPSNTPQT